MILRQMMIIISYEKGTNPVLVAACEEAISRSMPVSMVSGNLRISACSFHDFLCCIWKGLREASKGENGWAIHKQYNCTVVMPDEKQYKVWFGFDAVAFGIRYGSVDYFK